jgi:hypothetical protein
MFSAGCKQPSTARFRPETRLIDADACRLAEQLARRAGITTRIPKQVADPETVLFPERSSPIAEPPIPKQLLLPEFEFPNVIPSDSLLFPPELTPTITDTRPKKDIYQPGVKLVEGVMMTAVWRLLDNLEMIPGWGNLVLPGRATNIVISSELTSDCIRGNDYWSAHFRKNIEELCKRGVRIWPDILVQCGPIILIVEIKQRSEGGAFIMPWLQHERYAVFSDWMRQAGFTVNTQYALCRHTFAQGEAADDPKKFGYSIEQLLRECAQAVGIISLMPIDCVGHLAEMAHQHGWPIVLPPARATRTDETQHEIQPQIQHEIQELALGLLAEREPQHSSPILLPQARTAPTDETQDVAYRGPCYQLPAKLLKAFILTLTEGKRSLSYPAALTLLKDGYRVSDIQALLTTHQGQIHLDTWSLPQPKMAGTKELKLSREILASSSPNMPLRGVIFQRSRSGGELLPTDSPANFISSCGKLFAEKVDAINLVREELRVCQGRQFRQPEFSLPFVRQTPPESAEFTGNVPMNEEDPF